MPLEPGRRRQATPRWKFNRRWAAAFVSLAFLAIVTTAGVSAQTGGNTGGNTGTVSTATNTPVPATSTPVPTFTPVPSSPTPTSSLPTNTPGPTFTKVPTAAATATTIPPSQPTVTPQTISTPPPSVATVDASSGGKLQSIPTAAPGVDAVAVITPAADRADIDPVVIMPAPAAGETPVGVRFQPVDPSTLADALPNGGQGAKVIDFSVFDPTTGQAIHQHDRPIEFVFPISDADLAAVDNDPSRIAVYRIDRDTNDLVAVPCNVDLPHRVARCQTFQTSVFVLSRLQQAPVFRAFISDLTKNGRAFSGAAVGTGGTSSVTIYNTSANDASATLTLLRSDGTAALTAPLAFSIPAGGSVLTYLPALADVPDGNYAGYVESNQPVRVTGNTLVTAGAIGAISANGVADSELGRQLVVPGVYHSYHGNDSLVLVQNGDLTTAASVTVSVIGRDGVSTVASVQRSVPQGATTTVDLRTLALPDGFLGSVVVTSDELVSATHIVITPAGGLSSGPGVLTGAAVQNVPSVYNDYHGWNSSIVVRNVDSASADVTVTYSNGLTRSFTLGVGAVNLLYAPNEGLPSGFAGAARIVSTNGSKIAAVGAILSTAGGMDQLAGSAAGSARVTVPVMYRHYTAQDWSSSLIIQNVGSTAATVQITYVDGSLQTLGTVEGQSSLITYLPNLPGVPDGYHYGATVSSVEGASLVVSVNSEAQAAGLAAGDYATQTLGVPAT